jgi:hypothetical protein
LAFLGLGAFFALGVKGAGGVFSIFRRTSSRVGDFVMATPKVTANNTRRKKSPAKLLDMYGIAQRLDGGKSQVAMKEFADVELWAIGAITVQWALLEHALLLDTARLVNTAKLKEMPEYATSLSFKKRLSAWRSVVQETVKSDKQKDRLLKLGQRIANLESDRHKITHGMWQWSYPNASKLQAWSFRPPVAFRDNNFSLDRLIKLMERIGEVNFELSYPKFPQDKKKRSTWFAKQFLGGVTKNQSGSWSYLSRRFLLAAQGKDYATLVHPKDKRPIQLLQKSSFQDSPPQD